MDYPEWEFIESKTITDWDGFNTDYTLWYDLVNNVTRCMIHITQTLMLNLSLRMKLGSGSTPMREATLTTMKMMK